MNSSPKFSVVIPFYNRAEFAHEVIQSVLNQEYKHYEVIVVDDGSTDDMPQILESYKENLKIIYQGKKGPVAARNRGVEEASGKYIAFLDSDDLMLPWTLKTYAEIIEILNNPPLLIGRVQFFNTHYDIQKLKSKKIRYVQFENYLKKDRQIFTTFSMMVIRKDIFKKIGGCRITSPITFLGDDFDLMLRLSDYSPAVLVREPRTVLYRVHTSNESAFNSDKMSLGVLALLEKEREKDYPGGSERRIDRYAFLGGPAFDWGRKAIKAGHYKIGFNLLLKGFPMIIAKIYKKSISLFRGKTQTITLHN